MYTLIQQVLNREKPFPTPNWNEIKRYLNRKVVTASYFFVFIPAFIRLAEFINTVQNKLNMKYVLGISIQEASYQSNSLLRLFWAGILINVADGLYAQFSPRIIFFYNNFTDWATNSNDAFAIRSDYLNKVGHEKLGSLSTTKQPVEATFLNEHLRDIYSQQFEEENISKKNIRRIVRWSLIVAVILIINVALLQIAYIVTQMSSNFFKPWR